MTNLKNELIIHIVSDAKTMPEAIAILIREGIINKSFMRKIGIYQTYLDFKLTDTYEGACIQTGLKHDISPRHVGRIVSEMKSKVLS